MDTIAELERIAPLSEKEVSAFKQQQWEKHGSNRAWNFEHDVILRTRNLPWFLLCSLALGALGWKFGTNLVPTNGFGRSIDAGLAALLVGIVIMLALAFTALYGKSQAWWSPSDDVVLLAKRERDRLFELPLSRHPMLEGEVLQRKFGPDKDEPLAAVLWLVTMDESGGKVRRGVRVWTATELKQALNPTPH